MYYPEDLVEDIRSSSDIVDVISSYIKLDRKGSSFLGLCPFHNEKTPSFSVSRDKQLYHCFGCKASGNVFTFIMSYENFTFVEAIKYLAERNKIPLPEIEFSKEAREKADLKTRLFEINKLAANYFYFMLKSDQGTHAYNYLRGRQIMDQMIVGFGLGYSCQYRDDLYRYLREKGYSEELIRQSGLIQTDEKHGNYDKFWNRLMFPITDPNNKVIGFGGRVMGEGKPKYLNSPETPIFDKSRNLYGINKARVSRVPYFIVCEGYFDVIHLHQQGYTNSVATLGTALTYGHANLMKRYINDVYLAYDSDEAGVKATLKSISILREAGIATNVIDLNPYKDPDDFLNSLGKEEFDKRIKSAKNGFMYGLEVLSKGYYLDNPDDKTRFHRELANRLVRLEDEIERNNYIEKVSKEYGISIETLNNQVKKVAPSINLGESKDKPIESVERYSQGIRGEDGVSSAQALLLTSVVNDVSLYHKIKDYVQPGDFSKEKYQLAAKLLYQQIEEGKVNPSAIISHFTEEEDHREVATLFQKKIKGLDSPIDKKIALKEAVIKIKSKSLDKRWEEAAENDINEFQRITEQRRLLEELNSKEEL